MHNIINMLISVIDNKSHRTIREMAEELQDAYSQEINIFEGCYIICSCILSHEVECYPNEDEKIQEYIQLFDKYNKEKYSRDIEILDYLQNDINRWLYYDGDTISVVYGSVFEAVIKSIVLKNVDEQNKRNSIKISELEKRINELQRDNEKLRENETGLEGTGLCGLVVQMRRDGKSSEEIAKFFKDHELSHSQTGVLSTPNETILDKGYYKTLSQRLLGEKK